MIAEYETVQDENETTEQQMTAEFKISPKWVMAGDAIFTVSVPDDIVAKTGCKFHYTYRVQKSKPESQYAAAYFVRLLTGPQNTSDYSYVGKLNTFTGQVEMTRASKLTPDSFAVRLLNRVLLRAWSGDHAAYEQHGFRICHVGVCARCGRPLTVPESVASGFGPVCAKLVG